MKRVKQTWSAAIVTALPLILNLSAVNASVRATASIEEPAPIDALQTDLFKHFKSAKAKKLKLARDAIRAKQWDRARSLVGSLTADPVFGDVALWIRASAQSNNARAALAKRNWALAAQAARSSTEDWLRLEDRFPISPYLKQHTREIGLNELTTAQALTGQNRAALALKAFESSFQRLISVGSALTIEPAHIESFGAACNKRKPDDCLLWVPRLSAVFPKSSLEMRALLKHFPNAGDRPKPAQGSGRGMSPYKAPDLDLTAFDTAMRIYFEERWGQSVKQFKQFMDDFPRSPHRYRARYWLSQAHLQQQNHDQALESFKSLSSETPLSYYGLLAALSSGRPLEESISTELPMAKDSDPLLYPSESFHLKRAQSFLAEHAHDLAGSELREIRARDSLSSPFLMYLAMLNHRCGNYVSAFSLLGELISRGYEGVLSTYGMRMIFPTAYLDMIKKQAGDLGVDPILVISLVKQESAFDANALSTVGATGLMQIMPQTAVETDPQLDLADLPDAETNIRTGVRYLKQLLDRFNGNMVFALAAYNAGPNAVDRWMKEIPPKRGIQEFVESIPYRETREYVAGIIRNYFWYSRKLTGEFPAKGLATFWSVYGPPEAPRMLAPLKEETKLPSRAAPIPRLQPKKHLLKNNRG